MIRVCRPILSLGLVLLAASVLRAQSTTPATTQSLPAQTFAVGAPAATIDLKNHFSLPNVSGQVAQIDTVRGKFNIELLANDAPRTVTNFLNYVNRNAYNNALIHRSVPGFVIQGGGFVLSGTNINPIAADGPVQNEFKVPNTRGTLAMAKTAAGPNTATNQWFVNLADNRANLDNQNGGFTVFARVLGTGMSVPDNIAALTPYDVSGQLGGDFTALPLTTNTLSAQTLILINSVKVIPVYPASAGDTAVLAFSVVNPSPTIVTAAVSGSTLTLTPASTGGTVTLSVRATDVNGNFAESTFVVTNNASVPAPTFITQPVAQTVASGTTVVFNAPALGSPSYQWKRDGSDLAGATSATLVLPAATAAEAGTYTVTARNDTGSVTSDAAVLTVRTAPASDLPRLINLSIRTTVVTDSKTLVLGASVGPLNLAGSLPLVMRAVGPGLATFGVPGVLADPTMTIYKAGVTDPIATNDNWGSGDALTAAFRSVGAFVLEAGSLDSAYLTPAPGVGVGGYTVTVNGKGSASGSVLAEIYDAVGSARTATTPRLVNLSTRSQVDVGGDLLVGFVLRGTPTNPLARTVLIRAVGPSLAAFGLGGLMADPRLELFDADHGNAKLGENDNWGGDRQLTTAAASVGAFALSGAETKDAVILVTLPPGAYSARLSGVGGTGGNAIIEVYEVP